MSEWRLRSDGGESRSPEDTEARSRMGLADIQACVGRGEREGRVVNEAKGRQRG